MSRKCFELAEQATATTGRRATHRLVRRCVNVPVAKHGRSIGACHVKAPRIRAALARTVARVFSAVARAVPRLISFPRPRDRRHGCHRCPVDRTRVRRARRVTYSVTCDAASRRVRIRIVYVYKYLSLSFAPIVRKLPSILFSHPCIAPSRRERIIFARQVCDCCCRRYSSIGACVHAFFCAPPCVFVCVCRAWLGCSVNVRICFGNVAHVCPHRPLFPHTPGFFLRLSCHVSRG